MSSFPYRQDFVIAPTHRYYTIISDTIAYHHHGHFYATCFFMISWGRSIQPILPFLQICNKDGICNGKNGNFQSGMRCYLRYFGEVIILTSLHVSPLDATLTNRHTFKFSFFRSQYIQSGITHTECCKIWHHKIGNGRLPSQLLVGNLDSHHSFFPAL